MNILILEDNQERMKVFQKELLKKDPEAIIHITTNVENAITVFDNEEKLDMIFLDHDLDGRVYVDSSEPNTGYQFAKHLKKNLKYKPIIVVHTLNPAGMRNMLSELHEFNPYYVPFFDGRMEYFIQNQMKVK